MAIHTLTQAELARFWSKVDRRASDECWPWLGRLRGKGYGVFGFRGVVHGAHRVSYIIARGSIPDGLCICHRCDNPRCVNPSHLFCGTVAENIKDMDLKGRRRSPNKADGTHGSVKHPEAWARGDASGSRKHPERLSRGMNRYNAKLTDDSVREIRRRWAGGQTQTSLAAMFSVSQATIWRVVSGNKWRHV